jgi:hypothetical protein
MKNRIIQAYRQAPWRIQIQWIGAFLLGLLVIASITGIYLNINAQAAGAGRNIQRLESDIEDVNNEISDLTTELAAALSTEVMTEKAKELGFRIMSPSEAIYLEVPGYNPNADLMLAPPRVNVISEAPTVRPSYRLSLWEWLSAKFWQTPSGNSPLGGE